MYFQLKKLFSRAKTKEKDKKTGILKNAALKIIYFSFSFSRFPFMVLLNIGSKSMVLVGLLASELQIRGPCDYIAKGVIRVFPFGIIKLSLLCLVSYLCSMY